ncbi:transposase, MuDR, MULE transposase domain protein [Tanacetum coccineum]
MDNMNEVFDAKVTIRETLHTLTSIMNYIFQHEVKQEQNNDVCPPIRVFPDKIAEPLKKVRVSEVLEVIRSLERNNKFWWKKDPLVIPRGLAWSKIGNFKKGDYGALFAEWSNPIIYGQANGPITASPQGIQPIICEGVVHDPQFEQQPKDVVESVPLFTSDELVVEYHSITTCVQLLENVGDGDPSIVLKELADSAISNVIIGEISCQNLVKEQLQSRDMCIQSITNQFVQHPLESPKGKASESEIINVLTGQVSCDKYVGGFYECESSKLYYTDPKKYPSSSMTQLLQVAVPEQTSSQMLAYTPVDLNLPNLNELFTESQVNVNVVNENQPPSSEKVVGQLIRKRFVGKALVEPYTVQPPTITPSAFLKVDRKRLKRKARLLQIQNTRISFDDDVGDDDPDFKVLSLEEWESTKLKKKRNKKEPIRQSQIALKEIPLVEFHEDLSRAPYSRRTKVKLQECLDMVYALGDDTSHIFSWGNNDIFVYRSFWLNLLGLKEGGWLSDIHLDAWFELMWSFRPTDEDWAIASSYFCGFVMRGDIPGWVCNGVRYPVMWADVEQVFFSINEPNKHYCLGVLHIRTGVITLYDSLFSEAVETRKWWIKMRK